MTTNLTPGPWTWEDSPLSRVGDRRTFLVGKGTNILIHNAAWEVSEDDKNLIAAAPEMYAVVASAPMLMRPPRSEWEASYQEWLLLAQAALAKAEGGAA